MSQLWIKAKHLPTGHERLLCVPAGAEAVVGRASGGDEPTKLALDLDPTLSRRHFSAEVQNGRLLVRRLENKHPLALDGEERSEMLLEPGQQFSSGQTLFQVVADREPSREREEQEPIYTMVFSHAPPADALALPCLRAIVELRSLLSEGGQPQTLLPRFLTLLEQALPATRCSLYGWGAQGWELLAGEATPPPSRTLMRQAAESQKTVMHAWSGGLASPVSGAPTMTFGVAWAVAAPLTLHADERYLIYVRGLTPSSMAAGYDAPESLEQSLIAFLVETMARILVGARQQRVESQLIQFFSPSIRKLVLSDPNHSLLQLAPRVVTAFFFDLRGFSRGVERAQSSTDPSWSEYRAHHSQLRGLMTGVTERIFHYEGTVMDFQGDAVFACWGAPAEVSDHAPRAARVAHSVLQWMASQRGSALPTCGIGLATGPVLAGNVGVAGMLRYQAVGHCINLASRLESLTKRFRVPVLLSGTVAAQLPGFPLRRAARVLPAGMTEAVDVYELILPAEFGGSGITEAQARAYEEALDEFQAGRLENSEKLLSGLPLADPIRRLLSHQVEHFLLHGLPPGWDGIW